MIEVTRMLVSRKRILFIVGGICAFILATVLCLYLALGFRSGVPSEIVDFKPSSFEAKASTNFFYSVGKELKNSDQLDPHSPTLFTGEIHNFLVAPDQQKIAVVSNNHIAIVNLDVPHVLEVGAADSIFHEPPPIGTKFFRDQEFQWSRDSSSLYLIKDEFYKTDKGSQLFSDKGELWKYDLKSASLHLVIKPFPSDNYFFDAASNIYFDVPTPDGDLILKKFDGKQITDVHTITVDTIPNSRLAPEVRIDAPFQSFYDYDNDRFAQTPSPGSIRVERNLNVTQHRVTFSGAGKSYLVLTEGQGFKGPFYCDDSSKNRYLPGNSYFLLSLSCKNYEGQLLIDTQTALYKILSKDTRIYQTLNTETYPHFHISGGGLTIN
jgi:hypothetical protein